MLWALSLPHRPAATSPCPLVPFPWFLRLSGPIQTCFWHLPFTKLAHLTSELCAWLTPVTRLRGPELSLHCLTPPALRGPRRLAPELPADWFPNCPAARPGLPPTSSMMSPTWVALDIQQCLMEASCPSDCHNTSLLLFILRYLRGRSPASHCLLPHSALLPRPGALSPSHGEPRHESCAPRLQPEAS